jgi:hypothetical protein
MTWIYNTISSLWGQVTSLWSKVNGIASDVSSQISSAVASVNLLISQRVAWFRIDLECWVARTFATVESVWETVSSAITGALASISLLIHQQLAYLRLSIEIWVARFFVMVDALVDMVTPIIDGWIASVRLWFMQQWEYFLLDVKIWVARNFPFLYDLLESKAWKTGEALSDILNSILLFFRDPLRAIRDLIMDVLITWVCSGLAHEIDRSITLYGALTGPGGGSGGGEIGGVSPGMTGELAWPVEWMAISGNTWNNPPGHYGIDLHLPKGKKIFAMHDGILGVPTEMPAGYGVYCTVTGSKWRTLYGHGEQVILPNGTKVKRGEQIMIGDTTGRSTGDHLHLEIIYNGQRINPIDVLPLGGE